MVVPEQPQMADKPGSSPVSRTTTSGPVTITTTELDDSAPSKKPPPVPAEKPAPGDKPPVPVEKPQRADTVDAQNPPGLPPPAAISPEDKDDGSLQGGKRRMFPF